VLVDAQYSSYGSVADARINPDGEVDYGRSGVRG